MHKRQDPKTGHYDTEFKMEVIHCVLNEGLGSTEAARLFGIPNESTVRQWVKYYKEDYRLTLSNHNYVSMRSKDLKEKSTSELLLELSRLKKELEEEKFKTDVLNTLIDVAERDLSIDIRKKPGTKQSKKCK